MPTSPWDLARFYPLKAVRKGGPSARWCRPVTNPSLNPPGSVNCSRWLVLSRIEGFVDNSVDAVLGGSWNRGGLPLSLIYPSHRNNTSKSWPPPPLPQPSPTSQLSLLEMMKKERSLLVLFRVTLRKIDQP